MSGFTTSATLAEMIKRPMRKRRKDGTNKKTKETSNGFTKSYTEETKTN